MAGVDVRASRRRVTAIISGHVQGVGFRVFARRHAVDLDVVGYAENLPDGRVEVVAEGHQSDLELLLVRLRVGPTHAEVEQIETEWNDAGGMSGFFIY